MPDPEEQAYSLFADAVAAIEQKDVQGALAGVQAALELAPDVILFRRFLASIYRGTERWPEAVEQFRWLVQHEPIIDNVAALGACLLGAGEGEEGVRLLRWVVDQYPGYVDLRLQLADYFRENGDFDAAIIELSQALVVEQDEPWVYQMLSECYRAVGRQAEADRWATEARACRERMQPEVRLF